MIMERQEHIKDVSLREIIGDFIGSYMERDKNEKFSDWLGNRLQQEMPTLSKKASEKLAGEIIEAVASYDEALKDLKGGKSGKDWFADRLLESYEGMPKTDFDKGEELLQIEENLAVLNVQLMKGISENQAETESAGSKVDEPQLSWNKESVRQKADDIFSQIELTGMAVVANVMKERMQKEGEADIAGAVKETLQNGLIEDSGKTKAVVAGAVKVAVEKGVKNIIPENTPEDVATDMIGSMAGAVVESAEAMLVARDENKEIEAKKRISMAAIAAGGRIIGGVLKNGLKKVPIVGPVLVDLAGGVFDHLQSPAFAKNVYNTVKGFAVDAWKGVKESKIFKSLKKIKERILG